MACQVLSDTQALPTGQLIAQARRLVQPAELAKFWRDPKNALEEDLKPNLARLVYFQRGRQLAANHEWNEMTRLQLENELRSRHLLDEREVLTDWRLRLRLAGAVFGEEKKKKKEERRREEEEEEAERGEEGIGGGDGGENVEGNGLGGENELGERVDEEVKVDEGMDEGMGEEIEMEDYAEVEIKEEEDEENEGDEGPKVIFTRNNGQVMVF